MDKVVVHVLAQTTADGAGRWIGSLSCKGVMKEYSGCEEGLNLQQTEIHALEMVINKIKRPCCLEIYMVSGPLAKLINQEDRHEGYYQHIQSALENHVVQWYWLSSTDEDVILSDFADLIND